MYGQRPEHSRQCRVRRFACLFDALHDRPDGRGRAEESRLTAIDGRKLTFEVRAFDECGLIGQGTHERVIIKRQRFLEKAEAKKG